MKTVVPRFLRLAWSSTRYPSPELTRFARLYTCAILVMLSLNMVFAARTVADPRALHLLGITLLVVSGSAFVLLAHYQQVFHPMLFASIAMLFIVIPMMSWGLGEALTVTLLVYGMLTLSTLNANFDFAEQSIWTLQFIMLGASAVSLSLVIRTTASSTCRTATR